MSIPIYIILLWIAAQLTGCKALHPQPVTIAISPSQTASAFEFRTLESPELKRFLETNLHHEISPWPLKEWDIKMLTLSGFYYNPELDVARAKWGVAEGGVITAGERPNPNIKFTPQYNSTAINLSPWSLGFILDIPIETAGKRGYRISQARYLSEAARLNIATTAWKIRSRIRTGLVNLYSATRTEGILKKQKGLLEEMLKVMEERLTYGAVSLPEVTKVRISLEQTLLSLRESERQIIDARVQLSDALGLPVSALDGIEISFDFLQTVPENLPLKELRGKALTSRTDILSGLAEYMASQSALQLEVARQYPDVHLGPGYTWDQGDNKWSFGFSISLPILNQNEGPIAEADARRRELESRFITLQAKIIGEIDRAFLDYNAAILRLKTAGSLLSARREEEESMYVMFTAGEIDRFALLNTRFEVESGVLTRLNAEVDLHRLVGLLEDTLQYALDSAPETKGGSKDER